MAKAKEKKVVDTPSSGSNFVVKSEIYRKKIVEAYPTENGMIFVKDADRSTYLLTPEQYSLLS